MALQGLAPLGILAGGSLISAGAQSGRVRAAFAKNDAKAKAFIDPHKRAQVGEPYQGIEGAQLTKNEIHRFEQMARTDVDAAIQWAGGRMDRRVAEARYNKQDARAQVEFDQRVQAGKTSQALADIQLNNARRTEERRVALEASQVGPRAAHAEASRQKADEYWFPDTNDSEALVRAPMPHTAEFREITDRQSDLTEFLALTNTYQDMVAKGYGSLDRQGVLGRKLEAVTSRLQALYKGKLLDTNLGASISGSESALLTGGVDDPNSLVNLTFSNPAAIAQIMDNTQIAASRELTNISNTTQFWVGNEAQAQRTNDAVLEANGWRFQNANARAEAAATAQPASQRALGITPIDEIAASILFDSPEAQARLNAEQMRTMGADLPLLNRQMLGEAASGLGGGVGGNPGGAGLSSLGTFAAFKLMRKFL